jgi:hypothetical protein
MPLAIELGSENAKAMLLGEEKSVVIIDDNISDGPLNCPYFDMNDFIVVIRHGRNPEPDGGDTLTAYGFHVEGGKVVKGAPRKLYLPIGNREKIEVERVNEASFLVRYNGIFPVTCRKYLWDYTDMKWRRSDFVIDENAGDLYDDSCAEVCGPGNKKLNREGTI